MHTISEGPRLRPVKIEMGLCGKGTLRGQRETRKKRRQDLHRRLSCPVETLIVVAFGKWTEWDDLQKLTMLSQRQLMSPVDGDDE